MWSVIQRGINQLVKLRCTTASKSSTFASKHDALVTTNEKTKLIERVSKLNGSEKWKLSSGKFVEGAVCEIISKCHYDYPALHFVVDPSDAIWKEAFTKEESNEIRNFKALALPALDEDIQSYLDSFDSAQLKNAKDVCEFGTSTTKRWIQKSFIEAADLFEDNSKINLCTSTTEVTKEAPVNIAHRPSAIEPPIEIAEPIVITRDDQTTEALGVLSQGSDSPHKSRKRTP
ncbi:hypothetical protein EDC96DRAFT_73805 [Choanephora cucurbitarum]|nr:hypothetical protein EDC96DRAFT_73805 [Choanephora cucurbitarum]